MIVREHFRKRAELHISFMGKDKEVFYLGCCHSHVEEQIAKQNQTKEALALRMDEPTAKQNKTKQNKTKQIQKKKHQFCMCWGLQFALKKKKNIKHSTVCKCCDLALITSPS